MTPIELMETVVRAMDDHKAEGIVTLHVTEHTSVADYFVICTGRSNTQMKAIADAIDKSVTDSGGAVLHTEGYQSASWILIDLGSVIAHIFYPDMREFYGLERLWSAAERVDVEHVITIDN